MYNSVLVTTGDLKNDYRIIGPVYFQISNKGILSSHLDRMKKQYRDELEIMRSYGQIGKADADWGFLYGEWSVGQSDFELAFYIAVQELKKRAFKLGADAIISMRQDIDLDTNAFAYFYLQMYGTAVFYSKLNAVEDTSESGALAMEARLLALQDSSKSSVGGFRIAEFQEYSSAFRKLGWHETIGPNTKSMLERLDESFDAEKEFPIFVVYADSPGPRIRHIEFNNERLESEHLAMIGTTSRIMISDPKSRRAEAVSYDVISLVKEPAKDVSDELSFSISTTDGQSMKVAITDESSDFEELMLLLDAFLRRIKSVGMMSK